MKILLKEKKNDLQKYENYIDKSLTMKEKEIYLTHILSVLDQKINYFINKYKEDMLEKEIFVNLRLKFNDIGKNTTKQRKNNKVTKYDQFFEYYSQEVEMLLKEICTLFYSIKNASYQIERILLNPFGQIQIKESVITSENFHREEFANVFFSDEFIKKILFAFSLYE